MNTIMMVGTITKITTTTNASIVPSRSRRATSIAQNRVDLPAIQSGLNSPGFIP